MRYTIDPAGPIGDEIRRVARIQADEAIAVLADPGDDLVDAVHDCRKRCKMIRGLVRLVRPALGDDYGEANRLFRDAARDLSAIRDAHAFLGTFDALRKAHEENLPEAHAKAVRHELRARSDAADERAEPDAAPVRDARELLDAGRASIERWSLDADGFDAIGGGLGKTYARGRKALRVAIDAPTPEHLHEYRKRTKYAWYHVRLLDELSPSLLGPRAKRLHELSDALGDDHDLAVLGDQLRSDPEAFGGDDVVESVLVVVDGQRADLRRRAIPLGARLHAEKPKRHVERLERYWRAWHEHGPELRAGEIGDF